MQIAAFLSDIKSLSVCPHDAAIALVKPSTNSSSQTPSDPDIHRANELVSLHYDVKLRYIEWGPDPELVKARNDVNVVVSALNRV